MEIEVVKKDVYDELVRKVNGIDTNELAEKTDANPKFIEIKGEIPSIAGLAAPASPKAVENKLSNVSDLLKRKQIMIQK